MLKVGFTKDVAGENHSIINVDGFIDKTSFCFDGGSTGWYCDLHDQTVFNKLSEYSFNEVSELISGFNFPIRQSEEAPGCRIRVICRDQLYGKTGLFIEFESNADFWARPYSIVDLAAKFRDIVEAENRNDIEFTFADDESLFNGFGIFWTVANHTEIIRATIEKAVDSFFKFEFKAEKAAVNSMDKENLITYFSFPKC